MPQLIRSIYIGGTAAAGLSPKNGGELYELFIHDLSDTDKAKMKLLNEILDLLKNQPIDLLKMTKEQIKSFVALKESFIIVVPKIIESLSTPPQGGVWLRETPL